MTLITKWVIIDPQDGRVLTPGGFYTENAAKVEEKHLQKQGYETRRERRQVLTG
jgi:hypothetical protein